MIFVDYIVDPICQVDLKKGFELEPAHPWHCI